MTYKTMKEINVDTSKFDGIHVFFNKPKGLISLFVNSDRSIQVVGSHIPKGKVCVDRKFGVVNIVPL